jgi:hypothetical protein
MAGPLTLPSTLMFDAGPLGKVNVGGVVSGIGQAQGNWVPGDQASRWDLDNGQVFIEKNNGWWQYFIQAGAYNIPDLGAPTLSTSDWVKQLYGPFPQGFLKIQPSADRRRVHLRLREREHLARHSLEPGERGEPRGSA